MNDSQVVIRHEVVIQIVGGIAFATYALLQSPQLFVQPAFLVTIQKLGVLQGLQQSQAFTFIVCRLDKHSSPHQDFNRISAARA